MHRLEDFLRSDELDTTAYIEKMCILQTLEAKKEEYENKSFKENSKGVGCSGNILEITNGNFAWGKGSAYDTDNLALRNINLTA